MWGVILLTPSKSICWSLGQWLMKGTRSRSIIPLRAAMNNFRSLVHPLARASIQSPGMLTPKLELCNKNNLTIKPIVHNFIYRYTMLETHIFSVKIGCVKSSKGTILEYIYTISPHTTYKIDWFKFNAVWGFVYRSPVQLDPTCVEPIIHEWTVTVTPAKTVAYHPHWCILQLEKVLHQKTKPSF